MQGAIRKKTEIKIKWVGYDVCTWQPISVLSHDFKARVKNKINSGFLCALIVNDIWADFFDDPTS